MDLELLLDFLDSDEEPEHRPPKVRELRPRVPDSLLLVVTVVVVVPDRLRQEDGANINYNP